MILMTFLMLAAPLSGCIGVFEPDADDSESWDWIDPVTEIEDGNHSHNDLLAHRDEYTSHIITQDCGLWTLKL